MREWEKKKKRLGKESKERDGDKMKRGEMKVR